MTTTTPPTTPPAMAPAGGELEDDRFPAVGTTELEDVVLVAVADKVATEDAGVAAPDVIGVVPAAAVEFAAEDAGIGTPGVIVSGVMVVSDDAQLHDNIHQLAILNIRVSSKAYKNADGVYKMNSVEFAVRPVESVTVRYLQKAISTDISCVRYV